MSENFEQLLENYLPGEHKAGDIITAKITRKELEYSYLDINDKVEGRIRSFEVKDYEIGEEISVKVIRREEDCIIVSKLALDRIRELDGYNVSDVVSGTVTKKIKGGYTVRIKSNDAFLPSSLSGAKGDEILGKTYEFLIKEKNKRGLTVSRTDLTRKEITDYLETLNEDEVVKVTVKEILDFGVIVTLGPTTGLIHISEIDWHTPKDINSVLTVGQEIEAKLSN